MSDAKGSQPIQSGLLAGLDGRAQNALDHPLRREVLRTLNADGRDRSLGEIAASLGSLTVGEVNYHVQVLCQAGLIVSDATRPAAAGRHRVYRSAIAEAAPVLAVLRATRRRDLEQARGVAERPSSNLLSMFRTPRSPRTLRFGGRRKAGQESGY